jgi:hypothetical protein
LFLSRFLLFVFVFEISQVVFIFGVLLLEGRAGLLLNFGQLQQSVFVLLQLL